VSFLGLSRIQGFSGLRAWFGTDLTVRKCLAFSFLAGFFVRLIPEVLAFPYPVGFDTVYYAVVMKSGVVWANWNSFFNSTWLFNAFMILLYDVSRADPFLLLKLVVPLLYGLNAAGVFWFSRKVLSWNVKLSLLAVGLFSIQLASLRISWDLLRNTLGLGLLLFTLPFVGKVSSKRNFGLLVVFSLLTVFAHEYAAVTLLAVVLGLLLWHLLRKRLVKMDLLTFLAILPALSIFSIGIFLRLHPTESPTVTNVIGAGDTVTGSFRFFANYLSIRDSYFYYPTYLWLLVDVLVLFALLYLPYFYLVWKGLFRNAFLDLWAALLLIGSFGCLLFPFFALEYWDRWMFMLVYPFTFYAVNGVRAFLKNRDSVNHKHSFGAFSRKMKGMLIITGLLGCTYLATPVLMSTVNVGIFSVYPASVHLSFAPTVPYEDVDSVMQAMNWLNTNMGSSSCVVLHLAFVEWGLLYLDQTHEIVHFSNDVNSAVNVSVEHGFKQVFFIWWNENIGWYGITVPNGFIRLKDFGRISVYSYVSGNPNGS